MKIVGKTDIGLVRRSNQDTFRIKTFNGGSCLLLVCDGMGGARGGDIASPIAADAFSEAVTARFRPEMGDGEAVLVLKDALEAANRAVYQKALDEPELMGMGTTIVAVLVTGQKAYAAHVGDSRLYLFRDGDLSQQTKDHSYIQDLLDRGEITPQEARIHPRKHIITRVLGVAPMVEPDILSLDLLAGDRLLLCTDGLSGPCTDEEIAGVLAANGVQEAVDTLVDLAKAGGGYDNITIVAAECESGIHMED